MVVSSAPDEETGEEARGRRINQRALVLAAITIALVTSVILIVSLAAGLGDQYYEVDCPLEDGVRNSTCVSSLCPDGWQWGEDTGECSIMEGVTCCDHGWDHNGTCHDVPWCKVNLTSDSCCKKSGLKISSIAPGVYKRYCSHDMVWVEWRSLCMRT